MNEQKKNNSTISNEDTRVFVTLLDGTKEPVAKEIVLSDGRKAQIIKGKGRQAMAAQSDALGADGLPDMKKFYSSLMSALVLIDMKNLSPDDILDMDMKDYNAINSEFQALNF